MQLSGSAGFAATNPIQRAWRDLHFAGSHVALSAENNYAHFGRLELGLGARPDATVLLRRIRGSSRAQCFNRLCWLYRHPCSSSAAAFAGDSYPTRPIRLVVGFGAGGPTDIPARFIADRLASMLGQSVVVENKPGAGGMLATRDVLAQPRDGYNLLLCTHFESINTVLYKNPQYTLADLAPISLITKYYYALALSNAIPAANFEQFLAYAKAHPNEVSYITIGSGSAQEILAHQLERLAGISLNRIPYRGGPQVMQDLVSGRVHLYVSPALGVLPQYQSKDVKILGVSSPQRLAILPEVPTFRGAGDRLQAFRLARSLRRRGDPAADHRSAEPPYHDDCREPGLSETDRDGRLNPGFVFAGRGQRRAQANGG